MPDRLQGEADGKEHIRILQIKIFLWLFFFLQHSSKATRFISSGKQMKLRNVPYGFVKKQFDIIWTRNQYESTS